MEKFFKNQTSFLSLFSVLILFLLLLWGEAMAIDKTGKENKFGAPDAAVSGAPEETSSMTDIFDIKSSVPYPGYPAYVKWLVGALLGILLLVILLLAISFYKKKRLNENKKPLPVPPDKAALTALRKIRGLMNAAGKDFYFALSMILRAYIDGRFGINAMDMTTEELLPEIFGLDLNSELKKRARAFFRYSDSVKFANLPPERVKMEEHFKFVNSFVKITTTEEMETS